MLSATRHPRLLFIIGQIWYDFYFFPGHIFTNFLMTTLYFSPNPSAIFMQDRRDYTLAVPLLNPPPFSANSKAVYFFK
jgi:hypothetical protein